MISSEVKMIAVINKAAVVRKTKEGTDFVSLGVEVPIKDHEGNPNKYDISVSVDGDQQLASSLSVGECVEIEGILYFRKSDDKNLYLNLRASDIKICPEHPVSKLEGTLHFTGKLGKLGVENRQDKKGKEYKSFSAWSSEKDKVHPENYHYIWIRFRDFNNLDLSCAQPKESVEITGDLQLSLYKGILQIDSRLSTINPYVYKSKN